MKSDAPERDRTGPPDVYTVPEAAKRLRISRDSAYVLARTGELPVVRLGRSLRVPRAALEALLAGGQRQ